MPQSQTFAGTMSTLGTFAEGTFPYAAGGINWSKQPPISYAQPDAEVLEKTKWAISEQTGQPEWALAWNRYIVENFFNPILLNNSNIGNKRLNDEIAENVSVYYGLQGDNLLGYAADTSSIHVPGQHVRTLLGHMEGTAINIIAPIQESIVAKGLNDEIIKAKAEFGLDVELQFKLANELNTFQQLGAQMQPVNEGAPPQTKEDVEIAKQDFKHRYEIIAETLTTSWYWQNKADQLLQTANRSCLISNRASVHFSTKKSKTGRVPYAEIIPAENTIIDTRCIDQFCGDQRVGGYVLWKTPSEIFADYPELNYSVREDIYNMANRIGKESNVFCSYHNSPNNLHWTHEGLVSVAVTYWIGRRDLRYQLRIDRYSGDENYYLINDDEDYPIDQTSGKPVLKKGKDISGDAWTWDVHECHVIGNHWVARAGYTDYVLRENFDKSIPLLPMVNWNYDTMQGVGRSWCSRLKYAEYEMDRIKRKITTMLEQNLGKNFGFYGDKTKVSVQSLIKDLRAYSITVLDPTGNAGDPNEAKRIGETIDLSLSNDIQYYIAMYDKFEIEQQAIINYSPTVLGTQSNVPGKAVQQQTLATAQLSLLPYYTGLKNYSNNVLNYACNLYKNCLKVGDVTLPVSRADAKIISITPEFLNSDLGINILGDNQINDNSKDFLLSMLHAYSQNIDALMQVGLDPLLLLDLYQSIQSVSYNKGVRMVRAKAEKNKKEIQAAQQAQAQAEAQMQQQMIATQKGYETAMAQMKEENQNYRAEVAALNKYFIQLQQHIQEQDLKQKEIDAQLQQSAQQSMQQDQSSSSS